MTVVAPAIAPGLAGSLLIGLASAIMLTGLGRVAGVSGLTARAAGLAKGGAPLGRARAFVIGLPAGALLVMPLAHVPAAMPGPVPLLLGGMLVGFGTRLANGCTSGHGVSGLARLSPRSLLATAVFMSTGLATVAVMRHGLG